MYNNDESTGNLLDPNSQLFSRINRSNFATKDVVDLFRNPKSALKNPNFPIIKTQSIRLLLDSCNAREGKIQLDYIQNKFTYFKDFFELIRHEEFETDPVYKYLVNNQNELDYC